MIRPALSAPRHLETRAYGIEACRCCGLAVYAGLAEGLKIVSDVIEINSAGEIAAILDRRTTYNLRAGWLVIRDQDRIADPKLGRYPVVADHQCGSPLPRAEHRAPWSAPTRTDKETQCPF